MNKLYKNSSCDVNTVISRRRLPRQRFIVSVILIYCWTYTELISQIPPIAEIRPGGIELTCKIGNYESKNLNILISISNATENEIYIPVDPVQLFGQKGYYVSVDGADDSTLFIFSQVFPSPSSPPIVDKRSVNIVKLAAGEKYHGSIAVGFPLTETIPPRLYGTLPRGNIPKNSISNVRLNWGVFADPTLRLYVGHRIKGDEKVLTGENTGKSFLEIQQTVTSEPCSKARL